MIRDLSVVVIARNESFGIRKCLGALTSLPMENSQIICIDSGSTDDTRAIMDSYARTCHAVEVHSIQGILNAAVARNAGMRLVSRDFLLFLDGDMEVEQEFVEQALEILRCGQAGMVTGQLKETYYSPDFAGPLRVVQDRFHVHRQRRFWHSGGAFMVRSSIARAAGLWDESLAVNEDYDYTLRLSRLTRGLAIPVAMGTHHTLQRRPAPLDDLRKGRPLCFGVVVRRNLDRPVVLLDLMRRSGVGTEGLALLLLVTAIVMASVACGWSRGWVSVLAVVCGFCLFDLIQSIRRRQSLWNRFVAHYVCALPVIAGICGAGPRASQAG